MSGTIELPSHPFWVYSLRLYGAPGVQQACLKLQDEFDLDVNLILFCLWAGAEGPGQLSAGELQTAVAQSANWQREVVKPLRQIRRNLKTDVLGSTDELRDLFRPKVQLLEIDAEHVEQLFLADVVPVERGKRDTSIAVANLFAYLNTAGLAPTGPGSLRETVMTILLQAFPDAHTTELAAHWPV